MIISCNLIHSHFLFDFSSSAGGLWVVFHSLSTLSAIFIVQKLELLRCRGNAWCPSDPSNFLRSAGSHSLWMEQSACIQYFQLVCCFIVQRYNNRSSTNKKDGITFQVFPLYCAGEYDFCLRQTIYQIESVLCFVSIWTIRAVRRVKPAANRYGTLRITYAPSTEHEGLDVWQKQHTYVTYLVDTRC